MKNSNSAEEAEAKAALYGIQEFAKCFNGPVILEMDCASVMNELQHPDEQKSAICTLVGDIKQALKGFKSYRLSLVGRNCNKAAHLLAASARELGDLLRIGRGPDCIQEVLQDERSLDTG